MGCNYEKTQLKLLTLLFNAFFTFLVFVVTSQKIEKSENVTTADRQLFFILIGQNYLAKLHLGADVHHF